MCIVIIAEVQCAVTSNIVLVMVVNVRLHFICLQLTLDCMLGPWTHVSACKPR